MKTQWLSTHTGTRTPNLEKKLLMSTSKTKGKKGNKPKKPKYKPTEGPWKQEEFSRLIPLVSLYLDEHQSWNLQNVCQSWYSSKWTARYKNELELSLSALDGKDATSEFGTFLRHVKNLTRVSIYNCYVNDNHLAFLFPDKSVTNIEFLALDMLANHSNVTEDGIQKIVAACPKLHTLKITFLGGAKAFGCKLEDSSLKWIKEKLPHLRTLAVGIDISALPTLAQMTSLTSLRIRFCEPLPIVPPAAPVTTTITTNAVGLKLKKEEEIPPINLSLTEKNITELSRALSKNLKSLTLERLVFGWETFFRSLKDDSFQSLEELSLSYNYQPATSSTEKVPAKWTGKALRSLVLHSTANLTVQPFMDVSLRHLELPCISNDVKSALFKYLKAKGGHLKTLKATEGKLSDCGTIISTDSLTLPDINILAKYTTGLVNLDLTGCTVTIQKSSRDKVSRRASEREPGPHKKSAERKSSSLKSASTSENVGSNKRLKRSHSHNHSHSRNNSKKEKLKTPEPISENGETQKQPKTKTKSSTKQPKDSGKKHKHYHRSSKDKKDFDLVTTFSKAFPHLKVFRFSVQDLLRLKEFRPEIELIYSP